MILGLDLSLVSTGIATVSGGVVTVDRIRPGKQLTGHSRLARILLAATEAASGATLVVIEGLAMSSQTGSATERAGLHWMVRHRLWLDGTPYAIAVPQQVKKYATGKGNAGKDEVLACVIRRWGHLADVRGNDEADSLTLAAMGADRLGHPITPMPAVNRTALVKVQWPDQIGEPTT